MQNEELKHLIEEDSFAHLSDVELLKYCSKIKLDNKHAKEIFSRFSSNRTTLTRQDLSDLLLSTLMSFEYPPVLPDDAIDGVLAEFALETNDEKSVSFTEFKTFFLYFYQSPLQFLLEKVESCFTAPMVELRAKAAVFTFFVSKSNMASLKKKDERKNFPSLGAELCAELGEAARGIVQTLAFLSEPRLRVDILAIFADAQSAEAAEKAVRTNNGVYLMGYKVSCAKYKSQQLPLSPPGKDKKIAEAAAAGILGMRDAYKSVKDFAQEIGFTSKVKETRGNLNKFTTDVDRKTGISRATRALSAKADILHRQATMKVKEVDKDIGLTHKLQRIKTSFDSHVERIRSNENVKKGVDAISRTLSSVFQRVGSISRDTMDIVNYELQEKKENDTLSNAESELKKEKENGAKQTEMGKNTLETTDDPIPKQE